MLRNVSHVIALALLFGGMSSNAKAEDGRLEVVATAFNSIASQTDDEPDVTAWGDRLEPGMRAIAVSRDLIERGLRHQTRVTIDGLPGVYRVLDKMGARWEKKIDIYMGVDVQAARNWGVRPVTIRWNAEPSGD